MELIIVLAVISLLLGLSVTSLSSLSRNDLRSSAASLAEVVRYGHNQAIMTSRPWLVELDFEHGTFLARSADGNHTHLQRKVRGDVKLDEVALQPQKPSTISTPSLEDENTEERITKGTATIRILHKGLVEPARIILRDEERRIVLSVVPFTGRLRIESSGESVP